MKCTAIKREKHSNFMFLLTFKFFPLQVFTKCKTALQSVKCEVLIQNLI